MFRKGLFLIAGLVLLLGAAPNQAQAACEKSHVFLLLDVSGSMSGNKHTTVRTAIKNLMNSFGTKMRFGLATFGATYRLRVPISDSAYITIRNSVDSYPSNEGYTRMGQAINLAASYLAGLKAAEPAATKKRPYYLVLLTDGNPTGDTHNPSTEAGKLWTVNGIKTYAIGIQFNASVLNAIASAGKTGSAINASNSTSLTNAFNLIANTATKEVCDNLDNDCDGLVDEGLKRACNTACGAGQETCSKGVWKNCTATNPKSETCNGKDDDCDGRIDENWSNKGRSCSSGLGACKRTGKYVCKANGSGTECNAQKVSPKSETCNGIDDDCDGSIDENWPNKGKQCSAGSGACQQKGTYVCKPNGSGVQCSAPGGTPKPEVCDGLDNDCDGRIDNGLTRQCKTACGTGLETCQAGKWQGCTARQPTKETCDNVDNDCNGQVDNGLTRACSSACGKGTETCVGGRWVFCDAQKPTTEVCDGLDNDCDGQTDNLEAKRCSGGCGEGLAVCQNGKWSGCSGPAPEPEVCDGKDNDCNGKVDDNVRRECKTDCGSGFETCEAGQWGVCDAPLPQPELCDGKDNDCDGDVDENAKCPAGTVCTEGSCKPKCRNGECRGGLQCGDDGVCVGDSCAKVKCSAGKVCQGGICVDPCTLVTCDGERICSNGQCVREDCFIRGCPTGEKCVGGKCETDPCATRKCASGQFCRDGKCVLSCESVKCNADETCVDGRCQADPTQSGPCANVTCPRGQYCDQGKCIADPCHGVLCSKGKVCQAGNCVGDPCATIKCPGNATCSNGQCVKPGGTTPGQEPGDSETTNPDGGGTVGPDGGIITPKPDNAGGTDDSTNTETNNGKQKPKVVGGARYNSTGCGCNSNHPAPAGTLFLLLVGLAFVFRRKRV